METTSDRELWIARIANEGPDEELIAVYAKDMWACAWVIETPADTAPQDTVYRP